MIFSKQSIKRGDGDSSVLYDILKYICLVGFPAVITLWNTLAPVWNFPLVQEVSITLGAVATFLGALLGYSSSEYYKGNLSTK